MQLFNKCKKHIATVVIEDFYNNFENWMKSDDKGLKKTNSIEVQEYAEQQELYYISRILEMYGLTLSGFNFVLNNRIYLSTLHIYDYNDDTRIYIYENCIEDKAAVVYVPHVQDY